MHLRAVFYTAIVALSLVLTGCATSPSDHADQRQMTEGSLLRQGRFAVLVQRFNKNPESSQGGFVWRDDGANVLALDLTTPLGSTLARVSVNAERAVLTQSDGTQISAPNPDELIKTVVGQAMPVSSLWAWLRGRTTFRWQGDVDESENLVQDQQGRPSTFIHRGWSVSLSRYDEFGPRLISLKRQQEGDDISIRLVVD